MSPSRPECLPEQERIAALAVLNARHATDWQLDNSQLRCSLKFSDFAAAWAFMNQVAVHAERLDHHPDWSNVYNNVHINLNTHDAGGVTALDFELAHAIIDCLPA